MLLLFPVCFFLIFNISRNDARDFAKICGLLRVDYDTVPALKDWKVETYDDDAQEEFSDLENDCIEPEVRRTYK